ncbi:hypothetical protein L21SP5_03630 [Salinivirga cyanobacteriivorans]|uniref:Uncharacterized protein n=1 Tax=Salinivirga cyanobacteriivorans TaxID=1307839 RepID=A0A0S2I4G4_9BACT|nr:DUF6686 family protein [Salinivirga cyanobacteriivorans]ALO17231.1 hypothetical protein L21SP5_03630 [Salinivirga cyanobacteriivorans]
MKLISSTPNGQIFACPCQKIVHLEFGNLLLNLSFNELESFKEYVHSIDYRFYLAKNRNAQNRRKLLLHCGLNGNFLALNASEFLELKQLLSLKPQKQELKLEHLLTENINLN